MSRARVPLAVAAALFGAPAAPRSSRIVVTGATGPAAEVFPEYRAAKGERNRVRITLSRKGVTIVDRGVTRIRGEKGSDPLCKRRSARRFFCKDSFFVQVDLGDRNDTVSYKPGKDSGAQAGANPLALAADFSDNEGAPTDTTFTYGGTGNDTIRGSSFDDFIAPGRGRDKVLARGGPDTIALT